MHHQRNDYGKLIALMLLLCLLAAVGYALQHTISCFLLSWIIAYLLEPVLARAEGRGIKRSQALTLLYSLLGLLTIFFFTFLVPKLTISWNGFVRDLPQYIQTVKQLVVEWKTELPGRLPGRYGTEEIQWILDSVSSNIDTGIEKAAAAIYGFAGRIFFNLFNLILSPILVFFMLYYKHTVIDTVISWIPKDNREMVLHVGNEVNSSIGGYLRGQVFVSIIVALFSTLALALFSIPHPIFCGLFAGAASILPFIGVIIATLPALFFAWFEFQSFDALLKILLSFAAIYFLEGYVIKPLVFKKSMNLNPLVTIIMVMALGELLGFWGILLALPIAAAIKITWGHLIKGDF